MTSLDREETGSELNRTTWRGEQPGWPYREIIAIAGGVLGFWGGVGGLGSLILVIVLSQVREGAEPEVATYRYVKKVER